MSKTRKKLWQVSSGLDKEVELFTVGKDYILDQRLLPYDIKASLAHAKMLKNQGVLTGSELRKIEKAFNEILTLLSKGKFKIDPSQEDGHTALEQYLTEKYGSIGAKIHTGRSRNDQVLVMMRLYMLDLLAEFENTIKELVNRLNAKAKEYSKTPMPGYTHAQKAMPSDAKMWLGSYADALKDQLIQLKSLRKILDQSPLGSAAGFGIKNFKSDRVFSAKEMGFAKVQKNPMYCALSRGHFEAQFVQSLSPVLLFISRLNTDLLLFSMSEFQFVYLPDNMTTGSSIMPQKRNYDVLEIMRGKIALFLQQENTLKELVRNLMSGYNRDLQLSKEVFIDATDNALGILKMMSSVVKALKFNEEKIKDAMTEDLFVTEMLYELVGKGESFRDAYIKIKKEFMKKRSEN